MLIRLCILVMITLVPTFQITAQTQEMQQKKYRETVIQYADAMIKSARDTSGKTKSPLFASALNRQTYKLEKMPEIKGIREHDRSLFGSNPSHHEELYAILYRLSDLTKNTKYAAEADKALAFFFANCQSPKTGLVTWGEHAYWDFKRETVGGRGIHEIEGTWPYWDKSYTLNAEASRNFALGLWLHQVADHKTGGFSRHTDWAKHKPGKGADFPRYAGQMIETWTDAYNRKENKSWAKRKVMLEAIQVIFNRMVQNTNTPKGRLLAGTDKNHRQISWPSSNLELARCLWASHEKLPSPLNSQLKSFALKLDKNFLAAPHTITKKDGGFVATLDIKTGQPRSRSSNKPYTILWASGYGFGTHAKMANLCFTRAEQLEKSQPRLASQYNKLTLAAADKYLTQLPDKSALLYPGSFSQVINLLITAHATTKKDIYLKQAYKLADISLELFFDDGSALPKATNQHDHYEAITGATGLLLTLLELSEQK